MNKSSSLLVAVLLARPVVASAATFSYEASGQLSYVTPGAHPWAIGTPFTVRFR